MSVARQTSLSCEEFTLDVKIEAVFDSLERIDGKPRLFTDRNGLICAASSCAAAVIARHPSLTIEKGCLLSREIRSVAFLREMLSVPCAAARTTALGEPGDDDYLLIRASSVGDRHVCIVLITAAAYELRQMPELQATFGLTDSEAQIVREIISGFSPQVIAERRKSSIYTVRAHIRHCYQKLRVNTREQLMSKMLMYCF